MTTPISEDIAKLCTEGKAWDRRLLELRREVDRLRFYSALQTGLTLAWIAIALGTWWLFRR